MTDVADSTPNTHIFFVEKGEEKEFDIAKRLDTHPSLINRKSNRPRLADITKIALPEVEEVSLQNLYLQSIILNHEIQ